MAPVDGIRCELPLIPADSTRAPPCRIPYTADPTPTDTEPIDQRILHAAADALHGAGDAAERAISTPPIKERVIHAATDALHGAEHLAERAIHAVGDAVDTLKKDLTGAPAADETLGERAVHLAKDVTSAVVGGVTDFFKAAAPAAAPEPSPPTAP
ncbi:hypothetical protein T492DRAFT_1139894 [Pavlovales sp. CCMP2436]|nr:hypothetical protein T492DRAFT_1139894 [Pavlovales sp. CCMP2436]